MDHKNSIREFVNSFCKEFDVNICHDRTVEFCPCRFKIRSSYFCNFNQMLIDLSQEKESREYKRFLKLICKENRQELEGSDFLTKDIQNRMRSVVSDIENGRIKLGDIVYCTKLDREVILIEFPDQKHFDIYHKFGVFPGDIKYKTFNGEMGIVPIACINRISDNNYYAVYEINEKSNSSKKEIRHLERLAKRRGFRVNIIETEGSYKLEIYGDSQKEADEFAELCRLPKFLSL